MFDIHRFKRGISIDEKRPPLWRGEKAIKRACPVLWPRGVLKGREVLKLLRNRFKLPTPLPSAMLRHSPQGGDHAILEEPIRQIQKNRAIEETLLFQSPIHVS